MWIKRNHGNMIGTEEGEGMMAVIFKSDQEEYEIFFRQDN